MLCSAVLSDESREQAERTQSGVSRRYSKHLNRFFKKLINSCLCYVFMMKAQPQAVPGDSGEGTSNGPFILGE